jgi:hypothetical protein
VCNTEDEAKQQQPDPKIQHQHTGLAEVKQMSNYWYGQSEGQLTFV